MHENQNNKYNQFGTPFSGPQIPVSTEPNPARFPTTDPFPPAQPDEGNYLSSFVSEFVILECAKVLFNMAHFTVSSYYPYYTVLRDVLGNQLFLHIDKEDNLIIKNYMTRDQELDFHTATSDVGIDVLDDDYDYQAECLRVFHYELREFPIVKISVKELLSDKKYNIFGSEV